MPVLTVALIGALIKKTVDAIKMAAAGQLGSLLTQLLVTGVALGVLALAGHAKITEGLGVWGVTLGNLDLGSLVLGSLLIGSGTSVFLNDLGKQLDNSDSAVVPRLLTRLNRGGSADQPAA